LLFASALGSTPLPLLAMADFTVLRLEEGSSSDELEMTTLIPRGALRRGMRFVVMSVGIVATGALLLFSAPRHSLQKGDIGSRMVLFGPWDYSAWAQATFAGPLKDVRDNVRNSPGLSQDQLKRLSNLTKEQLNHHEKHLHDGNLCADDEEMLGGLCYAKCSDLTGGTHPLRTTAFACCVAEPCTFFNSKFTSPLSLCDGLDVAGKKEDKACPHAPGTCLANEEFNVGMCYKKCAILTNNTYPYRSAASTCCMYSSHWACIDAVNYRTSPDYNVGGGVGDGHKSTPNMLHPPIADLAEAAAEKTQATTALQVKK